MSDENLTYEAAYAELHKILEAIQDNEINLDQMAEELRRARDLVAFCKMKLRVLEADLDEIFEDESE